MVTRSFIKWWLETSIELKKRTSKTLIAVVSLIAVAVVVALAATLYTQQQPRESEWVTFPEPYTRLAYGPLNTTLTTWARFRDIYYNGDITYEKDGVKHKGWYNSAFEDGIAYIRRLPKDAVILSWWDYGHMITGLSGRSVIVSNPSKEMLVSVTNASAALELDPHEKVSDVAKALTAKDSNLAKSIMEKYGSKYIFVASGVFGDEEKAKWILYAAGIDLNRVKEYWLDGRLVDLGRETLLYKMLNKMEVEGFNLIYSDENSRIYEAK